MHTTIQVEAQKKAQDTVKNLMEKMINDAFKNSAELEAMTAQATGKGQNINVKA
jgi:hypothetical protein